VLFPGEGRCWDRSSRMWSTTGNIKQREGEVKSTEEGRSAQSAKIPFFFRIEKTRRGRGQPYGSGCGRLTEICQSNSQIPISTISLKLHSNRYFYF